MQLSAMSRRLTKQQFHTKNRSCGRGAGLET